MEAWSIPKGEFDLDKEEPLSAAKREFEEEIGYAVHGDFIDLGISRQAGGKIVHAWAVQGDLDPFEVKSNTFSADYSWVFQRSSSRLEAGSSLSDL